MRSDDAYRGVVVPMLTPFTDGGSIDEMSAIRVGEFLLDGGASLFLLGTTGEALSMSVEMRLAFVTFMMKHLPKKGVVYAGISDNALAHSVAAAERYHDAGVDVFVAHLPCYYPLTAGAMRAYYETLADRSPGPIMLYNVPGTTKISIPLEIVEELSRHPNIIGMKDSERDLDRLQRIVDRFGEREDFVLMCGWTVQSAATLKMGFDGIVPSTGNVIPRRFREMFDAIQQGDDETASRLQESIDPLAELHQKDRSVSQSIAGLKVLMREMGLCGDTVLPPILPLDDDEDRRLCDGLKASGMK